ncbi:hypothetical protein SDC9_98153 [bioreactor metagenome]|uniref:Uncharacterized protein n=1 Tax=bioreactor metagenome TaxID=1076179 RepID=A0A645ADX3_9ZZZZ
MIKVLYYYYYLFYKNIWKDKDPHLTTILSLSFIISLIINGIIDIILASIFSIYLNKYVRLGILIVIIFLMYYFFRKEKRKDILKNKPMIYSKKISKIISIVFLFIGLFFLFFNADIVRSILYLN